MVFGGDIIGIISHVLADCTELVYMVNTVHFSDLMPSPPGILRDMHQRVRTITEVCHGILNRP